MSITVSQLLEDFNKYALLSYSESAVVTTNDGTLITIMSFPCESIMDAINRLAGMFHTNVSIDVIREERNYIL